MAFIPLADGKRILWDPTTDLLCTYCRESIPVAEDPGESLAWTNFMFDLLEPKETSLVLGHYWYLHKRCMGIEDALMSRGARIGWGWYDMKSVLGLDSPVWQSMTGNVQKLLKKRLPAGAYDHLYHQWSPALPQRRQKLHHRSDKVMSTSGQPGYVYLIEAVGSNRLKIGHGQNAVVRLQQLRTGSPFPLRLIRSIPTVNSLALEQRLHRRYDAYNVHNEWFVLPPDLLAALLEEKFS